MSLADYVLNCHGILEGMTSENQQQTQQPRLSQKLGGKWMDMRLGNTLRISQPDGRWYAIIKPCLPKATPVEGCPQGICYLLSFWVQCLSYL